MYGLPGEVLPLVHAHAQPPRTIADRSLVAYLIPEVGSVHRSGPVSLQAALRPAPG